MVKKCMAMRMVTIFVALIVCGMFFPDLARGEDLSVNTDLSVPLGNVELGDQKITSVEITNLSGDELRIWPALDTDTTACPKEYFKYTGPDTGSNIYQMEAPGTVTVKVTFEPLTVCECTAWLKITPLNGGAPVVIEFTGNGVEKAVDAFKEIVIGGFQTGVLDREDEDGELISDMIRECKETANTIGQAQRCMSRFTKHLIWHGILSRDERQALLKASWKAAMSNIIKEMKTAKRSGRRDHRSSRGWWRELHHHWRH